MSANRFLCFLTLNSADPRIGLSDTHTRCILTGPFSQDCLSPADRECTLKYVMLALTVQLHYRDSHWAADHLLPGRVCGRRIRGTVKWELPFPYLCRLGSRGFQNAFTSRPAISRIATLVSASLLRGRGTT